ncbi:MAG: hypothetical protein QOE45_224 [Frankiaceae bacterium]|nr:hypothetical protein [Frankiaceae bacterium]
MTQPPPRHWLLGYRLLRLRLPEQYRAWVAEDVEGRAFMPWQVARTLLWLVAAIVLYAVGQRATYRWPGGRTLVYLLIVAVAYAAFGSRATLVRKTLKWQRVDRRGNPRAPKRLALLGNVEAVLLAVAVLVAFTGAAALLGAALRPAAVAECLPPDPDTLQRITAGISQPGTSVVVARSLPDSTGELVGVILRKNTKAPGAKTAESRLELIEVEGPQIYAFKFKGITSWMSFPEPPKTTDQAITGALRQVVLCLGQVSST